MHPVCRNKPKGKAGATTKLELLEGALVNKVAKWGLLGLCWPAPNILGLTTTRMGTCQMGGQADRRCLLNVFWMGLIK